MIEEVRRQFREDPGIMAGTSKPDTAKCVDIATRGALKATANKVTWQYFKEEEAPRRHIIFEPLSKEDGNPAYCSEQLEWHKEEEELTGTAFDFAVADFYKNLYDHITDGVPLVVPPEKVARQIEMIEEVHRRNPMPIRY